MAAHLGVMFVLPILLSNLLVEIVADPPYTYTEGFLNPGDLIFMNCTYDVKGTWGATKGGDVPLKLNTPGAKITYINVENNKPVYEQGSITKKAGGTGYNYVTFYVVSVESHGFLFHFDIRGTTPTGTSEKPLLGSCRG